MSSLVDESLRNLNDCGCCEGLTLETPVTIDNRPGLAAIAYRVGTHSLFKQSMLTRLSSPVPDLPDFDVLKAALAKLEASKDDDFFRLSSLAQDLPDPGVLRAALAKLKTRKDDDFSIALLDAWATVCEVLTFYQERIANESYLRTVTERVSLLQLARLIGYELRPGVAANAFLAFTLENAVGAPGQASINSGTKVQSLPGPGELPQTFESIEPLEARAEWNTLEPVRTVKAHPRHGDTFIDLQGVTAGLKEGDALLLVDDSRKGQPTNQDWDFRLVKKVEPDTNNGRTHVTLDRGLGSLRIYPDAYPRAKVYALRKRASLFGFNAPDPQTLTLDVLLRYTGMTGPATIPDPKDNSKTITITVPKSEWPFKLDNPINLDTTYPALTASEGNLDRWLVLSIASPKFADKAYRKLYLITGVAESSPKLYTLTSKATQVTLDSTMNLDIFQGHYRATSVFVQSELLELADMPLQAAITGSSIQLAQPVAGLAKGQRIIVAGKNMGAHDPALSEAVVIKDVTDSTITLQEALKNGYDPATVTIYANVALATQGESVAEEVLGSGDASQPYQHFTLRQSPLTYISAPTATGAASTLKVRVNDIEWHEVPTLYGRGPRERVFVTETDDDGKTSVEFGDGQTGARLPTGRENIRATYRKGIGLAGLVKAGQLSLLMTRPLGVKSVINPAPSSGAQDPEVLEDARRNAPLTVLTLDRVVSLQDYEDFARAFSGIAKSFATWTWSGQVRGVFVTVAGENGTPVAENSLTYSNLLAALRAAGDPYVPLTVKSYRPATFRLSAKLLIDADYQIDLVKYAVVQALRLHFSFDTRNFGQPVMESEVIAVMQNVAGVIAVDLLTLYRNGDTQALNPALLAQAPLAGADGNVDAAELLTLDPGPLDSLGAML